MRDRVTFRHVAESDTPFLRALYASTRQAEMEMLPWTAEQKKEFLDWQFEAQTKYYFDMYDDEDFMVVDLDGSPIGRLYLVRSEKEIEIIDIALMPELRRQGLGRQLLQEVLDEAARDGKVVTIYVEHFNPARHLYDRLGFQHIDTNGVYHIMKWSAAAP